MDLWDIISPSDLTAFSRRYAADLPQPQGLLLNQVLPDVTVRSNRVRVRSLTRTLRAAKFRVWDAENYIAGRPFTLSVSELELPPLGQKIPITEREILELALANVDPNGDVAATIYDDAETNVRATLARMELARGDLLTDGKVTINENGIATLEADFALTGAHKPTAAILWSNTATATPLADEQAWVQQMIDDGSPAPETAVTSRRVFNFLRNNAEYRAAFASNVNASTPALRPDQLNDVRSDFGLPPIMIYDTKVDVDGVSTRPIPDTKYILVAPDAGESQWGITAQALEVAAGNADPAFTRNDAPGIFTAAYKETGERVKRATSTHAVGMPVLFDKSRLLSATVA